MKTRTGYVQGYNAQLMVTKDQVIVAAEVTQQQNDVQQLQPMVARAQEELWAAGAKKMKVVVADAGYFSAANVKGASPWGPRLLIGTTNEQRQQEAMRERSTPRGRIPTDATDKERMERALLTKAGKRLYGLRSITVEPAIGQMKSGRGCDHLLRRGAAAAKSEWRMICASHNLLKLWRSGKALFARCVTGTRPRSKPCWAH